MAAETGRHPQPWFDLADVRLPVAAQVDVARGVADDLELTQLRCPAPGQLGELLKHPLVAPAGRVLLVEDRQHQRLALALHAEAGVEVDGQRHRLARQRGLADGTQQLVGPDREVEPEGPHQL